MTFIGSDKTQLGLDDVNLPELTLQTGGEGKQPGAGLAGGDSEVQVWLVSRGQLITAGAGSRGRVC